MQITDYVIADIQIFVPLNYNYGSYLALCKKDRSCLCENVHENDVTTRLMIYLITNFSGCFNYFKPRYYWQSRLGHLPFLLL